MFTYLDIHVCSSTPVGHFVSMICSVTHKIAAHFCINVIRYVNMYMNVLFMFYVDKNKLHDNITVVHVHISMLH